MAARQCGRAGSWCPRAVPRHDLNSQPPGAHGRVGLGKLPGAVQTQRDPAAYDVLDISHWEFWVASARTVREHETPHVHQPRGREPRKT